MYKVLIVDDELVIRQGMKNVIQWEELGMEVVEDADSGEKAYEYLCENPVDIIITDIRMEGMDGLTLIKMAREKYPHIHCIILSGYDDFEYTKKAIRLGIENYILKPIDENELMETLCSIVEKLVQEEKGKSIVDRDKQVILQSVLARWLSGNIGEAALRNRAGYLHIPQDGLYVQACVLRLLGSANAEKKQKLGMVFERIWRPVEDVWMCVCWDNNPDIVLVFSGDLLKRAQTIHRQLQELIKYSGWTRGEKLFAAFGTVQEDWMKLSESYRDARMTAELCLVLPAGSVVDYQEQYTLSYREEMPVIDFGMLETKIRSNQVEEIVALWDKWEKEMLRRLAEPAKIRGYVAEVMCHLIVLKTDILDKDQAEHDEQKVLEWLLEACTIGQMKKLLLEFSLHLAEKMECNKVNMNPTVRRVVEEVEKHYDQELTLRGLAEQFHVNPVYLGRLFREDTGEVFTAYLNNVRIREAKRLLTETDKSVSSIAALVGYQSQGYFTNMFKKECGCFPKEYRLKQS